MISDQSKNVSYISKCLYEQNNNVWKIYLYTNYVYRVLAYAYHMHMEVLFYNITYCIWYSASFIALYDELTKPYQDKTPANKTPLLIFKWDFAQLGFVLDSLCISICILHIYVLLLCRACMTIWYVPVHFNFLYIFCVYCHIYERYVNCICQLYVQLLLL